MAADDEIVTARAVSISPNLPIDNTVKNTPQSRRYIAESRGPSHIQIRLVMAQLAQVHARATLKGDSSTINKIFTFNSAFIIGNTSLVTILCIP